MPNTEIRIFGVRLHGTFFAVRNDPAEPAVDGLATIPQYTTRVMRVSNGKSLATFVPIVDNVDESLTWAACVRGYRRRPSQVALQELAC